MNILESMAQLHMLSTVKKRPLDINVETINSCPMKCAFCCNRMYKRDYTLMDNTLFENIVCQYVHMGGGTMGLESMQSDFLSDPLLITRMKIINKYHDKIWLHSTTPLISCKKYTDEDLTYILKTFNYLEVSVEGYDKESYIKMGGIDGFNIFCEQLLRIKKLIDENDLKVIVELSFRTCNPRELRRSDFYKEISNQFAIKEIKDCFFDWFGSIKIEDLPKGAKLMSPNNANKRINCVVPNATLAIQASGKVVGCGCIDWLSKYVIGDCNKNTLHEIWAGKKAVRFRNAFKNGKLPSICKKCGLYTSVDCFKNRKLLTYKSMDGLYYYINQ